MLCFTILSIYLSFSAVSEVLPYESQFHPTGWAITRTIEAFNNAGFSLSPLPLQYDIVVLLTLSAVILLGNVAYPIALRFCVWVGMKCARNKARWTFLLEHPRVCYTAMFPVRLFSNIEVQFSNL